MIIKYINMNIVYWFYNLFYHLEIKVALISYTLLKATSKADGNYGLIGLMSPHSAPLLAVPQPEWGMGKPDDDYHCNQQLSLVVGLTECSPMRRATNQQPTHIVLR